MMVPFLCTFCYTSLIKEKKDTMKRTFIQKYKPLNFNFYQNKDDFIVTEEPIAFTNKGNFIILKIKKENFRARKLS